MMVTRLWLTLGLVLHIVGLDELLATGDGFQSVKVDFGALKAIACYKKLIESNNVQHQSVGKPPTCHYDAIYILQP